MKAILFSTTETSEKGKIKIYAGIEIFNLYKYNVRKKSWKRRRKEKLVPQ